MQGNWNHGLPHYRRRFPNEYALANRVPHPRTVYLREAQVVPALDRWLATSFNPSNIERTLDDLTAGQADSDNAAEARVLAECNRKLARYEPPSKPAPTRRSSASGSPKSRRSGPWPKPDSASEARGEGGWAGNRSSTSSPR